MSTCLIDGAVVRLTFRAALWTGTWVAPLLIRRLPPFGYYDRPTHERALGASRIALLRQMLAMLKLIISFCYGADPEVRAAIG